MGDEDEFRGSMTAEEAEIQRRIAVARYPLEQERDRLAKELEGARAAAGMKSDDYEALQDWRFRAESSEQLLVQARAEVERLTEELNRERMMGINLTSNEMNATRRASAAEERAGEAERKPHKYWACPCSDCQGVTEAAKKGGGVDG